MSTRAETLVELLRRLLPGFMPEGRQTSTGKSRLAPGAFNGTPVLAKQLTDPTPFWRERFHHELDVYRLFDRTSPPVAVPRLVLADYANDLLVLERVEGPPLAGERYPSSPLERTTGAMVLAAAVALRRWQPPSGSLGRIWDYRARVARYRDDHGVFTASDADLLSRLLDAWDWRWEFAHGDLLLTNCLTTTAGLVMIDWEFAGLYLPAYDLALLWTITPADPDLRASIVAAAHRAGPQVEQGFAINQAIALARDIRLHSELPEEQAVTVRLAGLADDLVLVRQRLAALVGQRG